MIRDLLLVGAGIIAGGIAVYVVVIAGIFKAFENW